MDRASVKQACPNPKCENEVPDFGWRRDNKRPSIFPSLACVVFIEVDAKKNKENQIAKLRDVNKSPKKNKRASTKLHSSRYYYRNKHMTERLTCMYACVERERTYNEQ